MKLKKNRTVERLKREIAQLRKDISDMKDHHIYYRCKECDRIAPEGYVCPYCGADDSYEGSEA